MNIDDDLIVYGLCPACGFQISEKFYFGSHQPLATLKWPKSPEEARAMERLPLDFVRCVRCGHIYNVSFKYDNVPYSDKPNLMYKHGDKWEEFLESIKSKILSLLPADPVVVEIGHGDGSFLLDIASRCESGVFIGFDPNGSAASAANTVFKSAYFDPFVDVPVILPDLIVSRHVLEHLSNPLLFMQQISLASLSARKDFFFYLEVPCVDNSIACRRAVDYYYEHNSHFTYNSFKQFVYSFASDVLDLSCGYGSEVVYCIGKISPSEVGYEYVGGDSQVSFSKSKEQICEKISSLCGQCGSIVVWGGTGKAAAFINRYELDCCRFPHVVDSDLSKAGTYVPGTGQLIQHSDVIAGQSLEACIIPSQWRAADIVREMRKKSIHFDSIYIEHDGDLVEFDAVFSV